MKVFDRTVSKLWLCLVCVLASAQALAQVVSPESRGFSSQRLTRIETLMQDRIDAGAFPGAVSLVARDNEIVYLHAQGVMDIASGRPMQTDAVFRIMSMTKPVVAFAIMMMIEEGKVQLEDPASRFIPEFAGLRVMAASTPDGSVPASREITVRDLLTHSSGLMSGAANRTVSVGFERGDTLASVLPKLGDSLLEFDPGERWSYSAAFGFDVLAHIVEITSGVPFDTFVQTRIFEPLGMNDTYFYRDDDPNVATLYRNEGGELVEAPESSFRNGTYFSGGGGLLSTAEDYLKFALVMLNDGRLGGTRLLGRKTAEMMHAIFLPDTLPGRSAGEGFGLGMRVVTDSAARNTLLSEGSYGWSGAFNTHFFIDPEERVVGVYMTQISGLDQRFGVRNDFETAVMQALVD